MKYVTSATSRGTAHKLKPKVVWHLHSVYPDNVYLLICLPSTHYKSQIMMCELHLTLSSSLITYNNWTLRFCNNYVLFIQTVYISFMNEISWMLVLSPVALIHFCLEVLLLNAYLDTLYEIRSVHHTIERMILTWLVVHTHDILCTKHDWFELRSH